MYIYHRPVEILTLCCGSGDSGSHSSASVILCTALEVSRLFHGGLESIAV